MVSPTTTTNGARLGATGWGWHDVLPYFRKLETDLDFGENSQMHGRTARCHCIVCRRSQWPEFSLRLAGLAEKAGLPDLADQNGVFTDGHFAPAYTNRDDQRISASMAYLPTTVRVRPNLTISAKTFVTRVLFEGHRATGVEYERAGATQTARAGEVILSLGALHSPAMLMRAGIGPCSELSRHGIAPRAVREGVGRNLRDHPGTHLCAYVKQHARMPKTLKKSGHVALRFSSKQKDGIPSDLYMHCGMSSGWHGVGRRVAYFYIWLNKPRSIGDVALRDTDPHSHPVVAHATPVRSGRCRTSCRRGSFYCGVAERSGHARRHRTAFAVRFSPFIRLMNQVRQRNAVIMGALGWLLDGPAWLRRSLTRHVLSNAPPLDTLLANPEKLERHLARTVMSVSHVSGTCRMGAPDDPDAVVDGQGRVYGTENLRVVDASVMPSLPRANTNLPVLMIAEKMADAILAGRK